MVEMASRIWHFSVWLVVEGWVAAKIQSNGHVNTYNHRIAIKVRDSLDLSARVVSLAPIAGAVAWFLKSNSVNY